MWDPSQLPRPWLQWYQAGVPSTIDVPFVPLTWYLDDAARNHPRRTALVFLGRRINYRSLRHQVDRFAASLRRIGVRKGDRVALILPNCPQMVIGFLGAQRIGAVPVGHNPLYTQEELAHQLADCGARVAVVLDKSYETLQAVRHDGIRLDTVVTASVLDYLPRMKRRLIDLPIAELRARREEISAEIPPGHNVLSWDQFLHDAPPAARQEEIDPGRDLAAILYTGGTGGRPKGVMLTHRNIVANALQEAVWSPELNTGRQTFMCVLPLFHSFGLSTCLAHPLVMSATIVLMPRPDVVEVIRAIRRNRATVFTGVPQLYKRVLESPALRRRDLRTIKAANSGAIQLPAETIRRFAKLSSGAMVQGYGLTECSPSVTCNPLNGNARHVSVGLPLPSTVAIVVSEDDPGRILPPGHAGELLVYGPQVFKGYWNRPEETARALLRGWLRTGDIATMSPDGYFTVIERQHDLIKVSGFSVFPSEVEDVLKRHPVVNDCAVIGLPDDTTGERVVAVLIVHPAYPFSADELARHCEKLLTHYKVPHEFILRDGDLPRSVIGKLLRSALRREYSGSSV